MRGILLILCCQSRAHILEQIAIPAILDDIYRVNVIGGCKTNTIQYNDKIGFTLNLTCADDYISLLFKYVSAIKILYSLFSIKQGILRCCDDFKLTPKDIISIFDKNYIYGSKHIGHVKTIGGANFYQTLQKRFPNILTEYNISYEQTILPPSEFGQGDSIYLSNQANNIILSYLTNKNTLTVELYNNIPTYPYICDDSAIGYILNKHNIYPSKIPLSPLEI